MFSDVSEFSCSIAYYSSFSIFSRVSFTWISDSFEIPVKLLACVLDSYSLWCNVLIKVLLNHEQWNRKYHGILIARKHTNRLFHIFQSPYGITQWDYMQNSPFEHIPSKLYKRIYIEQVKHLYLQVVSFNHYKIIWERQWINMRKIYWLANREGWLLFPFQKLSNFFKLSYLKTFSRLSTN